MHETSRVSVHRVSYSPPQPYTHASGKKDSAPSSKCLNPKLSRAACILLLI